MKASEMANEELAECIESARLAPAKYVREDELNFYREAIREAAARLRNLGEIGEEVGLEATREKSSRVGNAAKMREALETISKCDISKEEDCYTLYRVCEAALAVSPRNCDRFATLDDARNAFFADYVSDETCSSAAAFAIWLYDEAEK